MLKPVAAILIGLISLTSYRNIACASEIIQDRNLLPKKLILFAQNKRLTNALDLGELLYDFTPVSQPQIVNKQHRDTLGSVSYYDAIELIVEAKHYILPLGYFAYFYDANGVEIGFTPVVISPEYLTDIQKGAKIYVTVPLGLLDLSTSKVSSIVVRKL